MPDIVAEVIDQAAEIDNLRAVVDEQDFEIATLRQTIADLNSLLGTYRDIYDYDNERYFDGISDYY